MTEIMRVPPNAMGAERSVLASVLLEPHVFDVVASVLRDRDDFYAEANALIFDAMARLSRRSQPIDHTTLREELLRSGKLAQVGGDEYLFALTDTLPTVANVEAHARIVAEKATVRRLLSACHEIAARGYGDYGDAASFLDEAEGAVFAATQRPQTEGALRPMDPRPIVQRIIDSANGIYVPDGISTGVNDLDRRIRGMRKGKLIVVAGRPGMGKSALMGVMARSCASTGKLACVFEQEMGSEEHDMRYMSLVSGVSGTSIERATIRADRMPALMRAAAEMDRAPLWRDDTPRITLPKIRSRVRRAVAESGVELGAIFVDHLGLMRWSGARPRGMERHQELGEYTKSLKELSKEWDVPIVLLVQLNRECERRGGDMRPQMSDLAESGSIEQDADQIVLLYRRGYYAEQIKSGRMKIQRYGRGPQPDEIQAGDDDGKIEMIVMKCRDGLPGTSYGQWDGECTRILDLECNQSRPEAAVRGLPQPHYTEGRLDDSDGDGEPFNDEDWNP